MTISIGIYSELAESGRMQHLMTLEQMTSGEVLQAGELEAFGIPCTTTNRISINQMHFRRGQSFSLRFREAAIDLAKNYTREGLSCLVIESPLHLTLWYYSTP